MYLLYLERGMEVRAGADTVITGSVLPHGIQRGYQQTCPIVLTLWKST